MEGEIDLPLYDDGMNRHRLYSSVVAITPVYEQVCAYTAGPLSWWLIAEAQYHNNTRAGGIR